MDFKVLLINPPFKYLMTAQMLPLGLINLGTILKNNGIDVKIVDFLAEKDENSITEFQFLPKVLTPEVFLQKFKKYDPDIVGITSYTENYHIALTVAQMCKRENPNVRIMLGGPHVTFQVKECLENNPFIDLIALGEIEHVITEIVEGLSGQKNLSEIQNIAFRKGGKIKNSKVNTVPDLAKIPIPDFDLIEDKYYPPALLHLEFARGCPYYCDYCSLAPFVENNVRYFPVKRIVENIRAFEERYKAFHFFLTDPTFLISPKRVREFLGELKRHKIELPEWDFQTRVDLLKRDILTELKRANAYQITLGIEDIHNSVLQACSKQQTFSQIERGLKVIKDLNFKSHSNFIIGLPSQTKEHVLDNISYASNLDRFNFSTLKPFPGSNIYNHPEKFGLKILSTEWESYITYEIVTDSVVFPADQQKLVLEQVLRHCAKVELERKISHVYEIIENKKLLDLGFDKWYREWKVEHFSGWN